LITGLEKVAQSISERRICVIIPTYNNEKTLRRVIDSVLDYTSDIIIVNDGSTDATSEILRSYPQLHQLRHAENSGKGVALRNGFEKARTLGFDYALTIDSDGQHYASDIPIFISQPDTDAILIGSRNMTQEGVPKKSSFGNSFSNFWFWFETGIRLEDTQSGYRLYPLHKIPKKYFTRKFELEIEIIVRSAWRNVPVKNVPIKVLYDPEERVSHFRPFKDFTRISILNTVLVIIALFYIFPRNILRKIKKKGLRKFLLENILESDDSNAKKAMSIALGVFVGISPFWGFQTVIVLFLAVLLRLNKAISFAFSNVSFPPFIPFIIYASLKVGGLFLAETTALHFDSSLRFEDIKSHITQYLIGSFTLAALCAVLFGFLSYALLSFFTNFRNKK
jgi:glycosyltransferase involved in cell wall biosynthesis